MQNRVAPKSESTLPQEIQQMNKDIENKQKSSLANQPFEYKPTGEDAEMKIDNEQRGVDFPKALEPEVFEDADGGDPATTQQIQAYIDKQLGKKLNKLQDEVNEMIDDFQLEVIRQFQIQQGTLENLIQQYMIDEETLLQSELEKEMPSRYLTGEADPTGVSGLYNEQQGADDDDLLFHEEWPDYIYLQEYQGADDDDY